MIKMKQGKNATQRINVLVNTEKQKLIISKLKRLRKKSNNNQTIKILVETIREKNSQNASKYLPGSELMH